MRAPALPTTAQPPPSEAAAAEPSPDRPGVVSLMVGVVVPAVLLGCVLGVVVRGFAAPLTSTDTYFHLRFGWEFLHGWSLRSPGSVTSAATAPWVPTQWLPEVVMAQLESWFGLAGVAWLGGLQVIALVSALYVAARRGAEPLLSVVLVAVSFVAASMGLSTRPQVISYVLVVVTVDAWLRSARDGRPRWWLVPVTWVWAMCHGMWPVGIALGCVAVAGIALDRRTSPRRWLALASIPLLSAVVAALTPVGPELYVQILRVQQRSRFFSEWQSPHLTSYACLTLLVLLAVTGVALLMGAWPGWVVALFLALTVVCSVWSWRTVPVAAVMAAPLAAPILQRRLRRASASAGRVEYLSLTAACLLAGAALAVGVKHHVPDPTAEPSWLQPAMQAEPSGTKILSSWDEGAVLLWRFPDLDVISHGYGDTYTMPELQRSFDIQAVSGDWVADLRSTGCRVAVVPDGQPLGQALEQDENWRVVHRSGGLEMLTAPVGW